MSTLIKTKKQNSQKQLISSKSKKVRGRSTQPGPKGRKLSVPASSGNGGRKRESALSNKESQSINVDTSQYCTLQAEQDNQGDQSDIPQLSFDPCIDQNYSAAKGEKLICVKPECLTIKGRPHRHSLTGCVEHPYCIAERLQEEMPIESRVPQPLPVPGTAESIAAKIFLKGVEQQKFGETGPQKPGTRTVPTRYSLDHYMVQQWNLDIDKMPGSLPPSLNKVQKMFQSYSRREIPRKFNQTGGKPTLEKKLTEWQQAQAELKKDQLVHMYWAKNQDSKIYAMIEASAKQTKGNKVPRRPQSSGIGKRTTPDKFKLESPRDQIPMVYASTMKIDPVMKELNREHEECLRIHNNNPGEKLSEITRIYYDKRKEKEQEEYKKMIMGSRSTAEHVNYLPTKSAKKRMDSEHLNSWMTRGEIQEIAERHDEYKALLAGSNFSRQRKSHGAQTAQASSFQRRAQSNGTTPVANQHPQQGRISEKHFQAIKKLKQLAESGHTSGEFGRSPPQTVPQTVQGGMAGTLRIGTPSMGSYQMRGGPLTKESRQTTHEGNRPLSTSASTAFRKNPSHRRYSRLFSAKAGTAKHRQQSGLVSVQLDEGVMDMNSHGNLQQQQQRMAGLSGKGLKNIARQSYEYNHKRNSDLKDHPKPILLNKSSGFNSQVIGTPQRFPSSNVEFNSIEKTNEEGRDLAASSEQDRDHLNKTHYVNGSFLLIENDLESKDSQMGFADPQNLASATKVFSDLISADEHDNGQGHVRNSFKEVKWQKDKDHLVQSMQFHLTKYRPTVQLTKEQQTRKVEASSHQLLGKQLLQHKLSDYLGIKDLEKVELPDQCVGYLSEVPTIIANKYIQDEKLRRYRSEGRDPCRQGYKKQQRQGSDFETLGGASSQASEQVLKRPMSICQTILDNSVQKTVTRGSSMIALRRSTADDTGMIQAKFAPQDPKPDTRAISMSRMESVKKAYIDKIMAARSLSNITPVPAEGTTRQGETASMTHATTAMQTKSSIRKSRRYQPVSAHTKNTVASIRSTTRSKQLSTTRPTITPGIGAPPTGQDLRRVTNGILTCLDKELVEEPKSKTELLLTMPIPTLNVHELKVLIKDMNSVQFWNQKGIQMINARKLDAAIDYFRQGLRQNPNDLSLIYCLAVCYDRLKLFNSALQWYNNGLCLDPRWVDGLCGNAIVYFNMGDYDSALNFINLAKNNHKGENGLKTKISFETICFIQSTCLKMTHQLNDAKNAYVGLEDHFKAAQSKSLVNLLWGLVLVPLSNERKMIANHYLYLKEYLEHLDEVKTPVMTRQNLLLSKHCIGAKRNVDHRSGKMLFMDYLKEPARLDFESFPKSIWTIINNKSFFKRFNDLKGNNRKDYEAAFEDAEVELYGKDQPVFTDYRVGVVLMGSIEVRCHTDSDPLKPYVVKKATEGEIIGFSEGDGGYSASPLTWYVSMQKDTEVIYFSRDIWTQIWNLQLYYTEQQIVLQKLEQNKYFKVLDMATKYHIVYESLELRVHYPGQLIMSINQRSPLCPEHDEYYKDGPSKFRKEIDNKIQKQNNQAANSGMYAGLFKVMGDSPDSPHLQKLKQSMQTSVEPSIERPDRTLTINPSAIEGTGQTQFTERSKLTNRDQIKARRMVSGGRNLNDNEDASSVSSHSTDYGLRHAHTIITKNQLRTIDNESSSEDGEARIETEINSESDENEKLDILTEKDGEQDSSLERDADPDNYDPEKSQSFQSSLSTVKPAKRKAVTRNNTNDRSNKNSLVIQKKERASRLQKTTSFNVEDKIMSRSMVKRESNFSKTFKVSKRKNYMRELSMDKTKEETGSEKVVHGALEREAEIRKVQITDIDNINLARQRAKTPLEKPDSVISYKFLLKKQATRIQNNDREVKRDHKMRKFVLNAMVQYAEKVGQDLKAVPFGDQGALNKLLVEDEEKKTAAIAEGAEPQAMKEVMPLKGVNSGSGINNTILINAVQKTLVKLKRKVKEIDNNRESNEEWLMKMLMKAIGNAEKGGKRRVEATGVHWIESGEVLVMGSSNVPNTRICRCDSFGMCDILRTSGPEFLGDVRAGLQMVQTFYCSTEDFKKWISIPEKIKMQDPENIRRFQGIINYVAARDKIPTEKLQQY